MIVAIEGHSYSGKTTLATFLCASQQLTLIAEHDVYAGSTAEYPPFPALNPHMARKSIDFFLDLEQRRYTDKKNAKTQSIVYDRSFISMILFQKYIKFLHEPGTFDSYSYAKEQCLRLLLEDKIALPDFFVFVRPDNIETYQQRQDREISVELLRGEKALRFFEQQYQAVYDVYDTYSRGLALFSNNSKELLARNATTIVRRIGNIAKVSDNERRILINTIMEVL